MEAKTNLKSRLPSRHVTEGPARAPHRSYDYAMGLTDEQIHVFKRTPYIADLKPAGRFIAKDLFEAGGIPLLMKTLLDNGFLHGECMTVAGCSMAENLESRRAAWQPRGSVYGSGYLWKYAQQVGSARHGAVTHPGGSAEKTCHADI